MGKTISILGCGWLGIPLGASLTSKGFTVKGSVRSEEDFGQLMQAGIAPYKLLVEAEKLTVNDNDFFACDTLVISLPPGRKDGQVHLFADKARVIRTLIDRFNISEVIFISSTSVYPDKKSLVKEEDAIDPEKLSGQVLLDAEKTFQWDRKYNLTILRLAGLIGLDRNPVRFFEKESGERNANAPLNLIHVSDAIGVIEKVMENNLWNEIFNACSQMHPTRQEFYELAAKLTHNPVPMFNPEASSKYKLVNSNKFVTISGYQFKYNNPLDYVREIYGN